MDAVTLYSTWPDRESAEAAARSLVEARLVACANILPEAVSVFLWEGEIQTESETVMFAKTTVAQVAAAQGALLRLHPYDTPCVLAMPLLAAGSSPHFLEWIDAETR